MHLDELRSILLSERETGRLIQIHADLFTSTAKEIETLTKEVYENEDPFSDRVRIQIERVSSIRETLCDIFRIRSEKILALAQTLQDGQYVNREELKKMLPGEREMFDQISGAIERARCQMVTGTPHVHTTAEGEVLVVSDPCSAVEPPEPPSHPAFVVSRVLGDMEPFMGVDGRIYHLLKEDIVTLPERNAGVLCERNIVLNINLSK